MASQRGIRRSGYRSKAARSGAAIGVRLFSPNSDARPMGHAGDAQACIRSALRRRRLMLGLTQEAAAGVLGMSRLTYQRIETGRRQLHFTELANICAMFNCHVGEIVQDGQLANAFIYAAKALLGEAPK